MPTSVCSQLRSIEKSNKNIRRLMPQQNIWQQDINTRWFRLIFFISNPGGNQITYIYELSLHAPSSLACMCSQRPMCMIMERHCIFQKTCFLKNPFWRVPKLNQFEFGNLIYSSKTVSEFELCVETRLRKYSAAYQAQERDCQKHITPFSRASGRDKTLAAERFFHFCGPKTKI